MKKVTLLIALAALVMFAGCKKDKETVGVTLKASIEQNTTDRTSLHPNGQMAEIHWTAGDQILVNNGTSNAIFTLTAGAGTKNGTFTYNGDFSLGESAVAVYAENATISDSTLSINLPEAQTAAAGTFGNCANPMIGQLTDPDEIGFISVCGVLGVSLTGDNVDITGIEIVSNNANDKLNGMFEMRGTRLYPAEGNSGTNREMLNCNATLTAEAQEFYLVLPRATLANGFTMNVYNGGTEPIFSKTTQSTNLEMVINTVKVMNTVEVTVAGGDEHEYVDLGLPSGLLWATCNVGADNPEGYGNYFAWGETTPKDTYNWSTYQYCNSYYDQLTKYCNNSDYGYNGFTDNLTTLLPEDDAATANWGNGWRMPTQAEFQELIDNTTVTWTQQGGVGGRLFTAANGNSLFLPAAGYCLGSNLGMGVVGYYGGYWLSSLNTSYDYFLPEDAWCFEFNPDSYRMSDLANRCYGYSVRPVRSAE